MTVIKQNLPRQRVRAAALLLSLLLFPITMNYLSPYLIIDSAAGGTINASFVVFGLLFLTAFIFFGRAWCGWVCPAGGLSEACFPVQNKPFNHRLNWIKWLVWGLWLAAIVLMAYSAGGYHAVDLLYKTETGISISEPMMYIMYYLVLGTFITLSLTLGKPGGCHTICWMTPFMILGRKLSNLLRLPGLRLKAEPSACTTCQRCTAVCPMSLKVHRMVEQNQMEHSECILCGSCVATCPHSVIHFRVTGP